jgi:hypothetical protein
MSRAHLSIGKVTRRLSNGEIESLTFQPGVNLLIGPPNTGKTKWLQMLDFLLGDSSTFESTFDEQVFGNYESINAEIVIGDNTFLVERRWKESGNRTKVFVNNEGMPARDFQHFLLDKLSIPLLHFPRGNPFSGQTWPELSFRMLLRHIYRQQRFWGGLADQQIEAEQHACLLQFLGLAEHIYTDDYGKLVTMKLAIERLKARRDQYSATLDELAGNVLTADGLESTVNTESVKKAEQKINAELLQLQNNRNVVIANGRDITFVDNSRGRIEALSEKRAILIIDREEVFRQVKATNERLDEMRRYRSDLNDELGRLARAEDASTMFADLKITHCPACDQIVVPQPIDEEHCHLCHQGLPSEPIVEGLGAMRLRFENDRLTGELKEADTLLDVLEREAKRLIDEQSKIHEQLKMVENELAPARQAISALVNEELSAIDMATGELNERQRQVNRLKGALELGEKLAGQIHEIEGDITPLQNEVDAMMEAIDFDSAEEILADGMTNYLDALNQLKQNVWRHKATDIHISRSGFNVKVGTKRWNTALGGTDTLYFLMSYHFGLLSLSGLTNSHYPGLSIIDLPGDFLGESIEDKENFIVQPFIDLLEKESFSGAQVIITGASFKGLTGVHRLNLNKVYIE